MAIVKVKMAIWKAINSLQPTQEPCIHIRIDQTFRVEWCHLNIFGEEGVAILWRFLPPLYFLNSF